ncbi:MAG: NAD(P)/FAD-dependent oxidoreductase [Methanomicrobiales archaeon]|nr:NAD(P)/FAD-dependent oxidoreductase [Methanomicrobiales archaeon]
MKVCIVGGGLAGLAAALRLGSRHEVDIYEKRGHLGGCLSSHRVDDFWIEQFYHHCFAEDRQLFSLLSELGLEDRLEWLKGTTGYFAGKTIYPLNTPAEILRYPLLSLTDKAKLALLTLRSSGWDTDTLDTITAEEFIIRELGTRTYESFFEPLMRSKFGDLRNQVSAAWLIGRIAIRSNRGLSGERLGYLKGGFQVLVDALAEAAGRDCTVRLHDPVTGISRESGEWRVNGRRYDAIISTIPPQALRHIGGPDLPPLPYQGAACLALGLDDQVTNGIYWLNMKDPGPYGAVITHTNFVPVERYDGHIVYLASYFTGDLPARADAVMRDHFCRTFGIRDSSIRWERMAVEPLAGPVFTTGYRKLIPAYQAKGFYWAGMFSPSNYPERSMEGSIAAGYAAAAELERAGGEP